MLAQNMLAILALASSVLALPWDTPYYPSPAGSGITAVAPTTASTPSCSSTRAVSDHHEPTPTASIAASPGRIVSSGNDGEGNQNAGNLGQDAGSDATNSGTIKGDYTVEQATVTCGNAQLSCCNEISKKGDTTNAGLLGGVLGSGDLGIQCSPINIPIIGIQIPINKACNAKAACCQSSTTQNGLVNVGCIALASLI